MDAGLQAFAEESRELLEKMEDTLLQLETDSDNDDLINELFRAVHTIKGSAGLFGFDFVVEFAHLVESVMGKIRDHEIAACKELLTLLLESKDHLVVLIEQALEGNETADEEQIAMGKGLSARLQGYLSGNKALEFPPEDLSEPAEVAAPAINRSNSGNQFWHLSLRFRTDVLRNGMDPLSFIRYLETVGDIVNLTTIMDGMPDPEEMDAECCYLGFEIDLNSAAGQDEVESVFEFVRDDCTLHMLPPHCPISAYVQLIHNLPEENGRISQVLIATGVITQQELDRQLIEESNESIDSLNQEPSPSESAQNSNLDPVESRPDVSAGTVEKQKKTKEYKEEENQVVRVNAIKLEELINLVGELVISGANTHLLARQSSDGRLIDATETLSGLVENIRDTALSLRMVQIGNTFNRFRRVVREVSRELEKEIDLVISGGETELDKTVVDKIADPLMHLVRNSIDHGIESPDERQACGKPRTGTVQLNAYHDSGSIVIEISDDGRGLVLEKILAKALEKQLIKENHSLTDQEIYRLIFEPGFSTAEKITNLSGRGVGMDVVRRNIDALRGQIDVESESGRGTKIRIRLPLTLAIIDGFLVRVANSSYVIPLDLVDECVEFSEVASEAYQDSQHINLRGEVLPYIRISEIFNRNRSPERLARPKKARENIVVARYAGSKAGLVVDELLGEHQTVIKPLGTIFQNVKELSGATILGSGDVAMIIDVPRLVSRVTAGDKHRRRTSALAAKDSR